MAASLLIHGSAYTLTISGPASFIVAMGVTYRGVKWLEIGEGSYRVGNEEKKEEAKGEQELREGNEKRSVRTSIFMISFHVKR